MIVFLSLFSCALLLSLGYTARTTADGDIQLVASQACVSLVKNTHLHMRTYHRKCTQTTCCFHMSTPRGAAGSGGGGGGEM